MPQLNEDTNAQQLELDASQDMHLLGRRPASGPQQELRRAQVELASAIEALSRAWAHMSAAGLVHADACVAHLSAADEEARQAVVTLQRDCFT